MIFLHATPHSRRGKTRTKYVKKYRISKKKRLKSNEIFVNRVFSRQTFREPIRPVRRFAPAENKAPPLRHGGAALVAKDSRMDGTRRSYFWLSAA